MAKEQEANPPMNPKPTDWKAQAEALGPNTFEQLAARVKRLEEALEAADILHPSDPRLNGPWHT